MGYGRGGGAVPVVLDVKGLINRRPFGIVSVSEFGAKGDGMTDDTAAIQAAVDAISAKGALLFAPGRRYVISDTITIDVSKVRAIIGNNAQVVITADKPAFHIVGHKTTGSADPTDNTAIATEELSPSVTELQVYSNQSPRVGVGLRVEGTFGLRIEGCHLFRLKTGIELVNRNRNIIIRGNHIWDCVNYGIHYNGGNLHQSLIECNHISYMAKCIFVDRCDAHNIHIVGNSIESRGATNLLHFRTGTNSISQVLISANGIEDHIQNTGALVLFENETTNQTSINLIQITGNEFSGSNNNAIEFISQSSALFRNVTITGNGFSGLNGYAVRINGRNARALTVVGNTITGSTDRTTGFFHMKVGGDLIGFDVSHNVAEELRLAPLVIEGIADSTGNRAVLVDGRIIGNTLRTSGTAADAFDWMVDMSNLVHTLHNVIIRNNNLRMNAWNSNGMKVAASTLTALLVIRENSIRGVPVGGTAFDLPAASAGTILVDDNISN